eukprot:12893338-Prorocentrum_lima.AAC.1
MPVCSWTVKEGGAVGRGWACGARASGGERERGWRRGTRGTCADVVEGKAEEGGGMGRWDTVWR